MYIEKLDNVIDEIGSVWDAIRNMSDDERRIVIQRLRFIEVLADNARFSAELHTDNI